MEEEKVKNVYNQSESRKSIYDEIDLELNKYYSIRYNEIALEYEIFNRATNQKILFNEASLLIHLTRENIRISPQIFKTYLKSHFVSHYNPLENYFQNLPKWDGVAHINKYASYVKTDDDKLYYYHLKKWAVRAIKTIFQEDQINKHCLILANGEQNAGKSTYLANLCPKALKQYYYENIGVSKDDKIKLCKAFIINIEELDVLGKYDINSIKAIISQMTVNERLPYADKSTLLYRICSFLGSTNLGEFLNDDTGNVRWIPFDVLGTIDFSYSQEFDVDNFWSEAFHIYKNVPDFKSDLTSEDVALNERRTERFSVQSIENESIRKYYSQNTDNEYFRTANDIVQELAMLGIKSSSQKIGSTLKKQGYARYKHSKKQVYGYNAKPSFK
jgi:predicted P-loop ATPase